MLGWERRSEEPDWVMLSAPDGGAGLSFQTETNYVRPVWPAGATDQPMIMHLDIRVDDLGEAGEQAIGLGAVVADFQPQPDVRVYLDPAGHPEDQVASATGGVRRCGHRSRGGAQIRPSRTSRSSQRRPGLG
ncbi:VOC family protein [Arthrobacter sp. Hz1]